MAVIVAFVAAIALEVVPLPVSIQPFRPPLPAMVLIYWAMMWPHRFGLGTAFVIGICLDILHGQLLGQNALALCVVTYLTLRFHLQIRIFPLWQLTSAVFALLMVQAAILYLIDGLAGTDSGGIGIGTACHQRHHFMAAAAGHHGPAEDANGTT